MTEIKTAHGRTREFNPHATGIDGSGETVFIVWTMNEDGSVHHMEKFYSAAEALCWMKWA